MSRISGPMKYFWKLSFLALGYILVSGPVFAQRFPRVYRDHVEAHWFGASEDFWYRNELPGREQEFVRVNAESGTRLPAFDHARAAAELSRITGKPYTALNLPINSIEFSDDGKTVRLNGTDRAWTLDLASYGITDAAGKGAPTSLAPDLQPHPSANSTQPTSITFINQTSVDAQLFWIDPGGSRVSYGVVAAGKSRLLDTYVGHVWIATEPTGRLLGVYEAGNDPADAIITSEVRPRRRPPPPATDRSRYSPDGKWEAFVRDNNLWLRDRATKKETPMSHEGSADDTYHADVSRERGVEMQYTRREEPPDRAEVFWSPDSRHVVAIRTHRVPERLVYLVESSPADQVQPKLLSYPYLKAGDPIPTQIPHLFDVEARREIPIDASLYSTPWDISDVRWSPDSSRFTFLYVQRGYQNERIISVNAKDGQPTAIVDERSKTFIDYADKQYADYLDDTHEIIWMSERDGWNHLYLYDALTGQVKNQITRGPWVVRGVDLVDRQKRQVWFHAGGIYPDQNPYYVHYCRINFDGTGLVLLTQGNGTHSIKFSPDRQYFIDTYSQIDVPPVSELRRASDGTLVCSLETADITELKASNWQAPIRFSAKGRDGTTDIFGVIYRPANWDPQKKYPVIEDVYAGPQDSFTPIAFSSRPRDRSYTDLGFVVVQADGMGTSNRSKAFHDVCWKNLGDGGFPDRILWMKAAAAKFPWMDITRVGIFGTSAGGQDALRALEAYGDFYKAAVADCGCYDNRMDKIWWSELWMGWPVGPEYAEQSGVNNAAKLQGKLLLIGCELDHNVDPATTMQVVNALVKANKTFELLVVPGAGHGGDGSYGSRRKEEFFVRNLLDAQPRHSQ